MQARTTSREKALRYDGSASGGTVNTYTWNARNQLTQVSQGGTIEMSYAYDALGRRASKTVQGGTPTQYLYDADSIVQETQGSSINAILTGLGIDERFARSDVTGRTYFLTDALNSTIALTDPTGTIKQQYSYDPYGDVTLSDTTTGFTNPYQYTGREADAPGLYYYRARYYSPMMGGFISEDPARFSGGQLSFYAYVGGDPTLFIDPTGESKLQGTTNIGGNDPLTPRLTPKSNPEDVQAAIEAAEDAIKGGELNPARLRQVRAWLKVAKRGFLKADCPPLLFDVIEGNMGEACKSGNALACHVYESLGGHVYYMSPPSPPST